MKMAKDIMLVAAGGALVLAYQKYGDKVIEAIANSLSQKEVEETWKKCFVHDWRKRTTTQVTFYELRLEEVTNLEEIKSQLKKLG